MEPTQLFGEAQSLGGSLLCRPPHTFPGAPAWGQWPAAWPLRRGWPSLRLPWQVYPPVFGCLPRCYRPVSVWVGAAGTEGCRLSTRRLFSPDRTGADLLSSPGEDSCLFTSHHLPPVCWVGLKSMDFTSTVTLCVRFWVPFLENESWERNRRLGL